jgi:hypothetical protein
MTAQFGRAASVVVANAAGQGIDLSQLHFTFSVTHETMQTPQLARVTIYNLSDATANQIQNEGTQLQVIAGYQGNAGLIFSGQICQRRKGRESPTDTYLDIYAQHSDQAYNQATVNTTLAAGWNYAQLHQTIAAAFSPFGVTAPAPPQMAPQVFPRGKVLYGAARDHARRLATSNGLTWTIVDGQYVMTSLSGSTGQTAIVLNSATGLLGIPEQTIDGIRGRCLLNPAIKVNSMVQINNKDINPAVLNFDYTAINFLPSIATDGVYRVLFVDHSGDSRGNAWYSDFICLDPNAPAPITPTVLNAVGAYLGP